MKKNFHIFRINGIWHCYIRLYNSSGKQIVCKASSKTFSKVLEYAWICGIEENTCLLNSVILI